MKELMAELAHASHPANTVDSQTRQLQSISSGGLGVSDHHQDFIDVKKEVPFVSNAEGNNQLAKITPAFRKLEELHI